VAVVSARPFVPYPLPVVSAHGCRAVAIGYWAGLVACPCCGESLDAKGRLPLVPRRWVDHARGDLGQCQACRRPLQPVPVTLGPRCPVHAAWDAEQAAKAGRRRGRPA
jgi:hypothetical protein